MYTHTLIHYYILYIYTESKTVSPMSAGLLGFFLSLGLQCQQKVVPTIREAQVGGWSRTSARLEGSETLKKEKFWLGDDDTRP